MELKRKNFEAALAAAKPALASKTLIEDMKYFWFDGKYVYTYEGGLGIRVKCPMVPCGLPGKTLLDLIKTATQDTLFIDIVDKACQIQMGRSKLTMAFRGADKAIWEFPKGDESKNALTLSEDIMEALRKVAFVRADKRLNVLHQGVNVMASKAGLSLYATDDFALATVAVNSKLKNPPPNFVLPWDFVDQVLAQIEPGEKSYMAVLENCLVADDGTIRICTNRLDVTDKQMAYLPKAAARHDGGKEIKIPDTMITVLERVVVLAGTEDPYVRLTVEEGKLRTRAKFAQGNINHIDSLKGKHDDASGMFEANRLLKALPHVGSMRLTDGALLLSGGEELRYVLAQQAPPKREKDEGGKKKKKKG